MIEGVRNTGSSCPAVLPGKLLTDVSGAARCFILTAAHGLYSIGYLVTVLPDGRMACEPIPNACSLTFEALTAYVDKYMNIDGLTPIVDKRLLSAQQLHEFQQKCQALEDESRGHS